jgi:acyl carrier protein
MLRDRLRTIIAAELDVSVDAVPLDASADTFQAWDSLGHMRIIVAIEEQLAVRFTTAEIPDLNSIEKLVAALAKKGIA